MRQTPSTLRRAGLTAALVAAVLTGAVPPSSAATQRRTLTYAVLRDGDPVGTQVFQFDGTPDDGTVHVATDVVVKIAFVPVYRFRHRSTETWRNGHLTELASTTDDDGEQHTLTVRATGDTMVVSTKEDGRHTIAGSLLPASLWNVATVKAGRLLNTLTGRQMAVSVTDAGPDTVEARGRRATAEHYALTGELNRELWYDRTGVLLHVRFAAKDASRIDYVLE